MRVAYLSSIICPNPNIRWQDNKILSLGNYKKIIEFLTFFLIREDCKKYLITTNQSKSVEVKEMIVSHL
jgi:hypothetical protein